MGRVATVQDILGPITGVRAGALSAVAARIGYVCRQASRPYPLEGDRFTAKLNEYYL